VSSTGSRAVIVDATIDHSQIVGVLTTASGQQRPFDGWLAFNVALRAILVEDRAVRGAPARTIGKRSDPPYDATDLPTGGDSHR
jgi:hypothetical protein